MSHLIPGDFADLPFGGVARAIALPGQMVWLRHADTRINLSAAVEAVGIGSLTRNPGRVAAS